MLVTRHNALRIDGSTARRYVVHGCVMEGGHILHAQVDTEPVEELTLPLPRDVAESWLLLYFEGLAPDRMRAVLDELTRPAGPRGHLA